MAILQRGIVAVAGAAVVCAGSACTTGESRGPGPAALSPAAHRATDGWLPLGADARGWLDSPARCADDTDRLVLLIGTINGDRYAVCEHSGRRVLHAIAPGLRAGSFDGSFLMFTAKSQQFLAEGMKIDLAAATVTVVGDPHRGPGTVATFPVGSYWSSF